MTPPIIGILVSTSFILLFSVVFRYERKNEKRILREMRESFDNIVLYVGTKSSFVFKYMCRDVFRQSIHYFFHSFLSGVLIFLEKSEKRVQSALHSNKTIAKKSSRIGANRNKLDEIAEHKISTALTDEEKKKRREEMLEM